MSNNLLNPTTNEPTEIKEGEFRKYISSAHPYFSVIVQIDKVLEKRVKCNIDGVPFDLPKFCIGETV